MASNRSREFEIKIAKAKDLPLSWFELVLRPEKFKQHIKTLKDNPNIEPTGLQLVATFLEKGGVLEGQTPLPATDGGKENSSEMATVVEERRRRLVNCALFIGSFMQWDISLFEKNLPPAVSYSLLVQLTKYYPLTTTKSSHPQLTDNDEEEEEEEEEEDSNLPREPPATLMAHILYCHWVLRFLTLSHLPPDPRRSTNPWDITCATPDQIKSLLEPQLSHCVDFLEEVCLHCHSYHSPSVSVSLPVMGRRSHRQGEEEEEEEEEVELCVSSSSDINLSTSQVMCQLHYSLGCHYFWHDDFKKAHSQFRECSRELGHLSACPSLVDQPQLRGFISACVHVRQKRRAAGRDSPEREREKLEEEEKEEDEEEDGGDTLAERLEHCRINDIKRVPEQLIQDMHSPSISLSTCVSLQQELAHRAGKETPPEPSPKRSKLDPAVASISLPTHTQVAVCNGVRAALNGHPPQPPFWKLFFAPNPDPNLYHFLFHVCGEVAGKVESTNVKMERLHRFVRGVCCKSKEPDKVWEMLMNSTAKSLATPEDTELMQSLFSSQSEPITIPDLSLLSSSSGSLAILHERRILLATNCQELLAAVGDCFNALPPSEHKTLAQKWVGSEDGYMNFDLVDDPILLTKYNAMVHKAHLLRRAQEYTDSVKFLRTALGLIPRPSYLHGKSSSSHLKPDQILLDLIFSTELKGAILNARHLASDEIGNKFGGLIDKAKTFCQKCYSGNPDRFDPMTLRLAAAFLLNAEQFQHLAPFDQPFPPGKVGYLLSQVAPRLAISAQAVREKKDARKSIRNLFSAVLTVFSTPVSSGSETRSDIDHKQLQLRTQFDVLIENLEEPTCLSFVLMALVRIWSILKKPEEEIRMLSEEYSLYWPTVIGSPGSVNADQVFRTLSSTLQHSLTVHPNNESWIILHAEILYAKGKHGAALLNYLKAGAMTSRHFEDRVPEPVWSPEVYRKIIKCCTQLNLYTHATLFCQLLAPVDYELAFSLLSNHSGSMIESYFTYFWDMAIIEFLIYTNAKRGDKYKQSIAVQIAGQPELNCNNSSEVLDRAAQVRRRKLLQSFYDQSFATL